MLSGGEPPAGSRAHELVESVTLDGEETCHICLEDLTGDAVRLRRCGHSFHKDCLMPWISNHHATCPLCRTALEPEVAAPSSALSFAAGPAEAPPHAPTPTPTPAHSAGPTPSHTAAPTRETSREQTPSHSRAHSRAHSLEPTPAHTPLERAADPARPRELEAALARSRALTERLGLPGAELSFGGAPSAEDLSSEVIDSVALGALASFSQSQQLRLESRAAAERPDAAAEAAAGPSGGSSTTDAAAAPATATLNDGTPAQLPPVREQPDQTRPELPGHSVIVMPAGQMPAGLASLLGLTGHPAFDSIAEASRAELAEAHRAGRARLGAHVSGPAHDLALEAAVSRRRHGPRAADAAAAAATAVAADAELESLLARASAAGGLRASWEVPNTPPPCMPTTRAGA